MVFVGLVYTWVLVATVAFLLAVFSRTERKRTAWSVVLFVVLVMFVLYVYVTTGEEVRR